MNKLHILSLLPHRTLWWGRNYYPYFTCEKKKLQRVSELYKIMGLGKQPDRLLKSLTRVFLWPEVKEVTCVLQCIQCATHDTLHPWLLFFIKYFTAVLLQLPPIFPLLYPGAFSYLPHGPEKSALSWIWMGWNKIFFSLPFRFDLYEDAHRILYFSIFSLLFFPAHGSLQCLNDMMLQNEERKPPKSHLYSGLL